MPASFVRRNEPAQPPPPSPPRSPERQHLAEAIAAHREATEAVAKVEEAQARVNADLRERLRPGLTATRSLLEDAKANAPRDLVEQLTGEDGFPHSVDGFCDPVAKAETAFNEAERRVTEARYARELLDQELAARQRHLHIVEQDLDTAVAAVVSSDPRKQELLDAFFRTGKHLLALAAALRTLRLTVTGVNSDECGLSLRLLDQTRPGSNGHASAFTPDAAFSMALADLRNDADVPLPDLPAHPPSAA